MIELETETERLVDGTCVVSIAGELNLYTAPRLEQALLGPLSDGTRAVIVDLTKCEFIDSTALGILLGANKQLRKAAGALLLVGVEHNIRKMLEITGLDGMLSIHPSRAAALNVEAARHLAA